MPTDRDHHLEAWVHWQKIYDWVHPYVNLGLSEVSSDAILGDELGSNISSANLSGEIKMAGVIISHKGPVPLGLLTVPAMASASLKETRNSDLARERLARRQLEVLYHHSKLFHQDTNRWPVTVAELDGYVDFSSNRQLLKLQDSSRRQFGKLLSRLFSDEDDEDEDKKSNGDAEDAEDSVYDVDDSIYNIEWNDDVWQLGYAKGQLEHLERLFIDMHGNIHRVEKKTAAKE